MLSHFGIPNPAQLMADIGISEIIDYDLNHYGHTRDVLKHEKSKSCDNTKPKVLR
jgi:hypothetical protein